MRSNYLAVEPPDASATVDFLSVNASVTITLTDGKIEINVKQSDSEDSSYFSEDDFEFELDQQP